LYILNSPGSPAGDGRRPPPRQLIGQWIELIESDGEEPRPAAERSPDRSDLRDPATCARRPRRRPPRVSDAL